MVHIPVGIYRNVYFLRTGMGKGMEMITQEW